MADIENWIPFEREIYLNMLSNHMKKVEKETKAAKAKTKAKR